MGRLHSNRLECERIQADLDDKIAQLALDNNAEKVLCTRLFALGFVVHIGIYSLVIVVVFSTSTLMYG